MCACSATASPSCATARRRHRPGGGGRRRHGDPDDHRALARGHLPAKACPGAPPGGGRPGPERGGPEHRRQTPHSQLRALAGRDPGHRRSPGHGPAGSLPRLFRAGPAHRRHPVGRWPPDHPALAAGRDPAGDRPRAGAGGAQDRGPVPEGGRPLQRLAAGDRPLCPLRFRRPGGRKQGRRRGGGRRQPDHRRAGPLSRHARRVLLLTALSTLLAGTMLPHAVRDIIFGLVVLGAVLALRD